MKRFATEHSLLASPAAARSRPLLRAPPRSEPGVVVVGASTGGPQALAAFLRSFAPAVSYVPVCVTLHMPRDLMPLVAAYVARHCGVAATVVERSTPLVPGVVLFAPGDRPFMFRRTQTVIEADLLPPKPNAHWKRSVDTMFTSAASAYGSRTAAVVLSGMGKDGLAGARAVVAGGGMVFVQDQASSAVWGMPGSVAKEALAHVVLAPDLIARDLLCRIALGRAAS